MKYTKKTLPNGLRVIATPIPSSQSVTLTVWVRTGSRNETAHINGISHFLEHMAFKGGKRYKTSHEVSVAIESLGAVNNAGTSKEWTNYWIKLRSEKLEKAFDILSDMILNPALRQKDIDREKGIIIEEIAMRQDVPMINVYNLIENLMYKGDPLGWDILGSKKTVRSLKRPDFVKYLSDRYHPENIVITIAGGVTPKKAFDLTKKYFTLKKTGKKPVGFNSKFPQTKPQALLSYKKSDQAHLVLAYKTQKHGTKTRYVESVLATMLGGGMSSRLFTEVREKRGLAYSVHTSVDHAIDTGNIATYAGVRLDKIDEAITVILAEHKKIYTNLSTIKEAELNKVKEYIKGHIALSLEDTSSINDFVGLEELLLGKTRTPQQVYKEIDKVTISQVTALAKRFFRPQNLNLAIIGPYKDQSRFEKLLK